METTLERSIEHTRELGNNGGAATRGTRQKAAAATEWRDLIADVEDLLKKIANVSDAEVTRVRERLQKTLAAAKSSATAGIHGVRTYTHDASVAADEYVRERPWTAVGLAAAAGALLGFIAGRR